MTRLRRPLPFLYVLPLRLWPVAPGGALWAALAAWCCLAWAAPPLWAAGTEFTRQEADIVMTLDSRWAGTAHGGYYPIRLRVVNRGPTRNLTFRFQSDGDGETAQPVVERRVAVEQNATLQFSLSVPLVSQGNTGQLRVFQDTGELERLRSPLSLSDSGAGETVRPALLIISPDLVDASGFEEAANSLALAASSVAPGGGRGMMYMGSSPVGRTEDHVIIPPVMLPETWLDYTGIDIVAVPLLVLDRIPAAAREALLKWMETGGTLLVYNVGGPAAESRDLARVLDLGRFGPDPQGWRPADPGQRRPIILVNTAGSPMAGMMGTTTVQDASLQGLFEWPDSDTVFVHRDVMLGRVYAFEQNPFPGSAHDWGWWLNSVVAERWSWTSRHGISARAGSSEFLNFLIPDVGGVPVYAFLVLITLFTIVIGPLNYLLLWKRKQLYLLVITIPVIALLTSVSLFGYAAIADGFGVKSRVYSVTFLDQPSKTAVALNRISLYAGMAPSAGLTFSGETAVYPIWRENGMFEGGRVDWTNNNQQLTAGWLRSRTRTQFLTETHRVERGRLEVHPGDAGSAELSIANGLAWDLETLLVTTAEGNAYLGSQIPAGAGTKLRLSSLDAASKIFGDKLSEHPLKPPPGASDGGAFWNFGPYQYYSTMAGFDPGGTLFARGQLMRSLEPLRRLQTPLPTEPSGRLLLDKRPFYVAVTRQNPGTEMGLNGTSERASLHVIIGRY